MNKPIAGLFYFLHTIRHIKEVGLVRNKSLAIFDDGGLRITWVVLPNGSYSIPHAPFTFVSRSTYTYRFITV